MLPIPTMARSLKCLLALCAASTLLIMAGCASNQNQRQGVRYVPTEVPQSLRDCRKAPSWSAIEARVRKAQRHTTQADVAEYVALMSAAGDDCRTKLAAIDRLLRKAEARARRT